MGAGGLVGDVNDWSPRLGPSVEKNYTYSWTSLNMHELAVRSVFIVVSISVIIILVVIIQVVVLLAILGVVVFVGILWLGSGFGIR